jgi:hypothetical protein
MMGSEAIAECDRRGVRVMGDVAMEIGDGHQDHEHERRQR